MKSRNKEYVDAKMENLITVQRIRKAAVECTVLGREMAVLWCIDHSRVDGTPTNIRRIKDALGCAKIGIIPRIECTY